MRALGIIVLFALCGCAAALSPNLATPGDEFLPVVQAVKTHLAHRGLGAYDVQVDARLIHRDALNVERWGIVDASAVVHTRSQILSLEGIPLGDLEVAERCNHLGGMRGLILEPTSPELKRLLESCRGAFRGITLGASLPTEAADGGRRYRVLAMGNGIELILDVLTDPQGGTPEVRTVHNFSS
jgi:hypothetical protein